MSTGSILAMAGFLWGDENSHKYASCLRRDNTVVSYDLYEVTFAEYFVKLPIFLALSRCSVVKWGIPVTKWVRRPPCGVNNELLARPNPKWYWRDPSTSGAQETTPPARTLESSCSEEGAPNYPPPTLRAAENGK